MTAPSLDIDIDPVWGDATDWEALAAAAASATAQVAPEIAHVAMLVSLVLADDEEVHALNLQWRAKDKPTNVLSFPMLSRDEVLRAGGDDQAPAEKGISDQAHTSHLIVHGLLHLAGYDHETGEAEAEEMEALERKALALLGMPDPYA